MSEISLPYRIKKNKQDPTGYLVQQNLEVVRDVAASVQASAGDLDTRVTALEAAVPDLWSHDLFTSNVTFTATTLNGAATVLTSTSRAYDGNAVFVEFYACGVDTSAAGPSTIFFALYRDSTLLTDRWGTPNYGGTGADFQRVPIMLGFRDTPSAASHTYTVKVYSTAAGGGTVYAGAGTSGTNAPGFVRVKRDILIP